ncbi:MAG: glycosyltransferase family 2 protein [Candidatus Planktophila sp.]|jgi:GT2 family glycosyltransferase|nr:glycosyltransferase family 2 protein [Candidatus Planktophila sp.]MBP7902698.1 glycosyltransferase family 2 protein [Candidatus Planktophila sp.]
MTATRITALLVVHDGATWLPEVVASITSQTQSADQILAIDTGSRDASAKLLKGARIPTVTLDRATSFGQAVHYGVSQLPAPIEGVQEWLWILHDDCALDPHALEELTNAVADRPNIVMAGPKLLGWHDRTHLLEVGISIATNGSRWTGLEPQEYDQGQHDGNHEVLSVSTAGALIRRDVFEELGGFDINLELFRDDVDFGWRVHSAGHSVLAVTSAIGFHAQAASSERRAIDIEGAPLHRPLLLDRRNAAYVLLANSSWWKLPLLTLQLLSGAAIRSIAYLFAKLPGYASDEILAIASLLIHPGELLKARKDRKRQRLVSSGVVGRFIPSRWTQLRSGAGRVLESIRSRIFPDDAADELPVISDLEINEDEDILEPLQSNLWRTFFTKPLVIASTFLLILTFGWTRHRWGAISGGALAVSPSGTSDIWKFFLESWHHIGMGSNIAAPAWVLFVGAGSLLTFGSVPTFISLLFIVAPFLALWSAQRYLRTLTASPVLTAISALLYALSPIAISAINGGHLGVVLLLILFPIFLTYLGNWQRVEERSIRNLFAFSLFFWLLQTFNPSLLLILLVASLSFIVMDFQAAGRNFRDPLFLTRLSRRSIVLFTPLILALPTSLTYFSHPSRLLIEIGIMQPGGGGNLALLANPGGAGSLPWWSISPITLLLIVTYFSTAKAREYARYGIGFLLSGALLASLQVTGNGSSSRDFVYAGAFLVIATALSVMATVIMFDDVRSRLENSHFNYQHIAVGLVILLSASYTITSSTWVFSAGASSPLQRKADSVLPAFLAVESDAKTLVIRPIEDEGHRGLAYYIARGGEVTLGQPDVVIENTEIITRAVEGLIDNTGVGSSKVFSSFGIKYVFVKNPANQELIQTIDGLGGFNRASATDAGTVWKVAQPTGRAIFTDFEGKQSVLPVELGAVIAPGAGTITLTENYSQGWQALAEGVRLERSENQYGLPEFKVFEPGEINFLHDGTSRRAWLSLFLIALVTSIVMALPAGRRRRELTDREVS